MVILNTNIDLDIFENHQEEIFEAVESLRTKEIFNISLKVDNIRDEIVKEIGKDKLS